MALRQSFPTWPMADLATPLAVLRAGRLRSASPCAYCMTPNHRQEILEKQALRLAQLILPSLVFLGPTEHLDRQLGAIHGIFKSKLKVAENLQKKSWALQESRLAALEESLNSERKMNAILTEELDKAQRRE